MNIVINNPVFIILRLVVEVTVGLLSPVTFTADQVLTIGDLIRVLKISDAVLLVFIRLLQCVLCIFISSNSYYSSILFLYPYY
jgi:hypothetical protein